MPNSSTEADAKLKDLDVREVSIVDRPANKRRFLIVKNDIGNLAVIRTEEKMPSNAAQNDQGKTSILKDDDLANLLGLEDTDEITEIEEPETDEAPLEPIFKATVAELTKVAKAVVQKLMAIVNKLKAAKGEKKEADSSVVKDELKKLATVLVTLISKLKKDGDSKGSEKEQQEKASKDVLEVCNAALAKMMAIVNTLKDMEPDSEITPDIVKSLQAVSDAIASVSEGENQAEEMADKKKPKQDEAEKENEGKSKDEGKAKKSESSKPEVFVKRCGNNAEDLEVILKVGTKMKKTRLSSFKKAVEMLSEILKEIEASKDGNKVLEGKADKAFESKMLETLDSIKTDIGKVSKRVDEIETGGRPAGADADPPAPIAKKKNLWDGVF